MVGQHPQCYGMPELNLFLEGTLEELVESMGGYKQIQLHGLLRAVAQIYVGEQTIVSLDAARRWLIRRYKHTTARVYQELCARTAPLIVVDKSPAYALHKESLDRIAKAFPDARYIHLLRHPRSQGDSIMKIAKGAMAVLGNSIDYDTDPPTIDPQIVWCRLQENILGFLEGVPIARQLRLRGEDLLNDPLNGLRGLCRWLEIAEDDVALAAMLHPEDSPYACLGPLGAHLGNDINFLRSPAYRPGTIPMPSLDGPLPWRTDGRAFNERTLRLAHSLGYS
jgi:hypothetical protein